LLEFEAEADKRGIDSAEGNRCPRRTSNAGGFQGSHDNSVVDPGSQVAPARPERDIHPVLLAADERELVAAVLRQDRKAAARFVSVHIDAIYSYVRHRLTPRWDLVEDVVQDVFLAALSGLAHFHGRSSLRTWLLAIARHKVEDVYRQLLRHPELEARHDSDEADGPQQPDATIAIDDAIDIARDRVRARRILARLPERYGLILLWRYWEQRSTRDIATAIRATEKSVERMLARARARFKELWLEERDVRR
jgi:RNA polymerase sigma-70 factor, ECF subfamily